MSSIARWSYTNIATVWPFLSEDTYNGGITYDVPYTIACTWTGKTTQHRDSTGAEFIARDTYWTEDQRPKYRDMIVKGDLSALTPAAAGAEEIRDVTNWDMSPFGEADSPDFSLVT